MSDVPWDVSVSRRARELSNPSQANGKADRTPQAGVSSKKAVFPSGRLELASLIEPACGMEAEDGTSRDADTVLWNRAQHECAG
jgi:hypothetical protein